ncbi:MAG: HD domain-containing protein [Solirubrobacteraceae bacterium]
MGEAADGLAEPLELIRSVLFGRAAWLVGGIVRDHLLGMRAGTLRRPVADVDLIVAEDPRGVADALARAGRATSFPLSEELDYWRVVAHGGRWQIDVEPLHGGSIEADLARRDFTVNAIAQTLDGSETIDPLGGRADLEAGRLRMAGEGAFRDDPLRVMRLVRQAVDLDLRAEQATMASAREAAPALVGVAGERVFDELKMIVGARHPVRGLELMADVGAGPVVLPELEALRGVQQSRFHHRDVYGHTLEVLEQVVRLCDHYNPSQPQGVAGGGAGGAGEQQPGGGAGGGAVPDGELRAPLGELLAEDLADGLSRADALRWGALLHDAAKPLTREVSAEGTVTFLGHDVAGAELAGSLLRRLRSSERTREHVAALVRHHLRLGFLVHQPRPLARGTVYGYLRACGPIGVDVTLLSIADRLATRGDRAAEAIERHVELAGTMLADALRWRAQGVPVPLWRGDELAGELGIEPGPALGELLESMRRAQYAGEVRDRAQALAYARAELALAGRGA